MSQLILLRHGECEWDITAQIAGWCDPDLTDLGVEQARVAGELMASSDALPAAVHTSTQIRSIRSANRALAEAGRSWLPTRRSWRLNERHFGALHGAGIQDVVTEYGAELWLRFLDVAPPASSATALHRPTEDVRYAALSPAALPNAESFRDVQRRVLPYWHDAIVADLRNLSSVLVLAHEAPLVAIVAHVEGISPAQLGSVQVLPGVPIVYELDAALTPTARPRHLTGTVG